MKILIALPVYNEERILATNTKKVLDFCRANFYGDEFKIVIADNNSQDQTGVIGRKLAANDREVDYFFLPVKGKGRAWKTAFQEFSADIYIFMDIDLATDLPAMVDLVAAMKNGYDLVIGSRYLKESKIARSWFRSLFSLGYRWLVKKILNTKISDFQCGFKAMNQKIVREILSLAKDQGFFLDTEVLALAEGLNFKIKEIPVDWSDYRHLGRKSKVNVLLIAINYLCRVWRLRHRLKKMRIYY